MRQKELNDFSAVARNRIVQLQAFLEMKNLPNLTLKLRTLKGASGKDGATQCAELVVA